MSKKPYTATSIKQVDVDYLNGLFEEQSVTVGVDVAKDINVACLMGLDKNTYAMVQYNGRHELGEFIDLLKILTVRQIAIVLEPSGTYGDPLIAQARLHGFDVFKMRPNKCGQARELFDNVPSLHDGKSAYLLARLHRIEASEEWRERGEVQRKIQAYMATVERKKDSVNRLLGPLEGSSGRHWPEVSSFLKLSSTSLLVLFKELGGPAQIAARPDKARAILRSASQGKLSKEKINAIIDSASQTLGMEMLDEEVESLRELAREILRLKQEIIHWTRRLEKAALEDDGILALMEFSGTGTACVLVSQLGDVRDFGSAAEYEKAAGLNLKEKSSGRYQGQLRITKRGPRLVRKFLFLMACRKIQKKNGCPFIRAWYQERLKRNGGCKLKALTAVMRKLIRALYHIGRGAAYDPHKLFDVSRLEAAI